MPSITRTSILLAVTAMVILGACSSSIADSTSTTATTPAATDGEAERQMCRTLELLEAGGVTGPAAAIALRAVDLTGANSPTKSAYGALLISAPRSHCPTSTDYADDVAYWLGF